MYFPCTQYYDHLIPILNQSHDSNSDPQANNLSSTTVHIEFQDFFSIIWNINCIYPVDTMTDCILTVKFFLKEENQNVK